MAPPCRFWAAGTCKNGNACRFEHVAGKDTAVPGGVPPAATTPPPCKFFAQGNCARGESCRFSHLFRAGAADVDSCEVRGGAAGVGAAVPTSPAPPIVDLPPGSAVFSIDVECVATGTQHNDRSIAQISLVDAACNVFANLYVKPDRPVVSHLTPLTGLTAELLDQYGVPLETALAELRRRLPPHAVLVGQNILKDVHWLGLKEGDDFTMMVDLAGLLKVWNPQSRRYAYFGLDHYAKVWLGAGRAADEAHDAVADAVKSVRLFLAYQSVMRDAAAVHAIGARVLTTTVTPSFAKQNPVFEGVCQGNKKTCTCGAPFYS